MLPVYNTGSEALEVIETVYTYEKCIKEYKKTQRKSRQKAERIYYMKQRLSGMIMAVIGIAAMISFKDATFSLLAVPLGIVHSKGIPLVKPYFDHIGGISHSVDNNIDMT